MQFRISDPSNLLPVIQLIALALPAVAILMQYSLSHLERIEEQYEKGEIYLTPAGRMKRKEADVNLQQWTGFSLVLGLIPLSLSGILLLIYLLLYPSFNTSNAELLYWVLLLPGFISIIIFFLLLMISAVFSGGGMPIKGVKYLASRINSFSTNYPGNSVRHSDYIIIESRRDDGGELIFRESEQKQLSDFQE